MFSGFLFMSIIINLGSFMNFSIISKIFDPIIPASFSLIEPLIATILINVVGV